ncbi:MAG: glycerol-3-phosphate 1-O-acyltransferase PlsY [Rikenellaceae bacterium]|nr:glycerol-3-phosphate 1-O-acyltransferase PlsY [Rikenellaceae bacterium]
MNPQYLLLIPLAYIIGSFSGAISLGKLFYGVDIRDYGSKNPGANNVQRVLGWQPALFVFVFDIVKGVAAVSLVRLTSLEQGTNLYVIAQIVLGTASVAGHIFPLFFGFKGGKGVATLTGVLWAIHPPAVLICFSVFLVAFAITRYVSFSAIIGITLFPFFVNLIFGEFGQEGVTITLRLFSIAVAVIIWLTHLSNIKRIISGTEEKFRLKRADTSLRRKIL